MPPRATYDPTHPDFPHGEPRGYKRGCREDCCRIPLLRHQSKVNKKRRRRKRQEVFRRTRAHIRKLLNDGEFTRTHIALASGVTLNTIRGFDERLVTYPDTACMNKILAVTREDVTRVAFSRASSTFVGAGPVRSHLEHLVNEEDWPVPAVAGLAGVDQGTVHKILNGSQNRVQVATYRAIMSVALPKLRRHAHIQPARRTIQKIHSIRALGYPMQWQGRALGYPSSPPFLNSRHVTRRTAERVDKFAERFVTRSGYVWATPEMGIAQRYIDQAKTEAAAATHHLPACYDEDGRLIPGAVPEPPLDELAPRRRGKRDTAFTAWLKAEAVRFTEHCGFTHREAAQELHRLDGGRNQIESYERFVERARDDAGLVQRNGGTSDRASA